MDQEYRAHDSYHGHGTHVATTAAGNFVADVSVNGLASGVASGVAPYAHLAIYKVCGGPKAECSGLAYDIDEARYTGYLCYNFGQTAMRAIARGSAAQCSDYRGVPQEQLNYPSIVVSVLLQEHLVTRTLTNVHADGLPETYKVEVAMPGLVLVDVEPTELTFSSLGQIVSYDIPAG